MSLRESIPQWASAGGTLSVDFVQGLLNGTASQLFLLATLKTSFTELIPTPHCDAPPVTVQQESGLAQAEAETHAAQLRDAANIARLAQVFHGVEAAHVEAAYRAAGGDIKQCSEALMHRQREYDGALAEALAQQGRRQGRALFDYEGADDTELSFREGDVITVVAVDVSGWWLGELDGLEALFPHNYVKMIDEEELSDFTSSECGSGEEFSDGDFVLSDESLEASLEMLDECSSCRSIQQPAEYCTECGVSLLGCPQVPKAQHVHNSLLDAIRKGATNRLRPVAAPPAAAAVSADTGSLFNLNLALAKQRSATGYSDEEDTEEETDWD